MGSAPSAAASVPYEVSDHAQTAQDAAVRAPLRKRRSFRHETHDVPKERRDSAKVRVRPKRSANKAKGLPRMPPPHLAISCSSFIVIKWTPPAEEGWNFEYGVQMSPSAPRLEWRDVSTDANKNSRSSAFIRGLKEGECHVFRVRYRRRRLRSRKVGRKIVPEWGDWSGYSPWSAPSSAFAAKNTCPAKPLAPTVHEIGTMRIKFAWQAPSSANGDDISEYTLRVASASNDKSHRVIYTGNQLSCTCALKDIDFFERGRKYLASVAARNGVGLSQFSEPASFVIKTIPKIEMPRNSRASASRDASARHVARNDAPSASRDVQRASFRHLGLRAPVYVSTLKSGWRQYYDPASDQFYYSDPTETIVQWHPPEGAESPPPSSSSEALIINLPDPHASFTRKRFQFLWYLRKTANQVYGTGSTSAKILKLKLRRDKSFFFGDCLNKFSRLTTKQLKTHSLRVEYVGESGIDSGGIANDFFLEASKAAFDPAACLFAFNGDSERATIDPRSSVAHGENCATLMRFAGRMLAKAVYDRRLTAARLSSALLKALTGRKPDISDLSEVDEVYARSLSWVLSADAEELEGLDLRWTVDENAFGKHTVRALVKGGEVKRVTIENRREYVDRMVEHLTGGNVQTQLDAFVKAFHEIVPPYAIEVFTVSEMDLLLNGKPDIIVDELKSACVVKGEFRSGCIDSFWGMFEACTDEQKASLLRFWTGTSRVPLDGYDPPLNITKLVYGAGDFLPRGRTCFNSLVLPEYSSQATCLEKVMYAAEHCTTFQLT